MAARRWVSAREVRGRDLGGPWRGAWAWRSRSGRAGRPRRTDAAWSRRRHRRAPAWRPAGRRRHRRRPWRGPACTRVVCSLASTAMMPSEPAPPAATKRWWRCSDGSLRVQRQDGALELLGADRLGHVARDQQQSRRRRSARRARRRPGGSRRWASPPGAAAVGHEQARRTHQVGLGRPEGGEVQLVVADHGGGHAERPWRQACALPAAAAAGGRRS